MASAKILENKKAIVSEIEDKIKNSESVIIFSYQGLTVSDLSDLRVKLHGLDSEVKVYKNTLLKRALENVNVNLDEFLEGPNAILFGKDLLEPIKVISEFAKDHDKADIRVGIINGERAELETIKEYASIPSREVLLAKFLGSSQSPITNFARVLNEIAKKGGPDACEPAAKEESAETPAAEEAAPTEA